MYHFAAGWTDAQGWARAGDPLGCQSRISNNFISRLLIMKTYYKVPISTPLSFQHVKYNFLNFRIYYVISQHGNGCYI